MDLDVWPRGDGAPHHGEARWNGAILPCAIGRAGIRADKREGDHATPVGDFAFRRVLYRPDREATPASRLATAPIGTADAWCDDPGDPAYNRPISLPYPASHELLWRGDALYDLVLVIGHNDDPPVAGKGSAIFVHVARPDWGGTEGCIAFQVEDLRRILAECETGSRVRVHAVPRRV